MRPAGGPFNSFFFFFSSFFWLRSSVFIAVFSVLADDRPAERKGADTRGGTRKKNAESLGVVSEKKRRSTHGVPLTRRNKLIIEMNDRMINS